MDYKPGDVANGHRLGEDLVWRPLSAPTARPVAPPASYGERYRRRFKWTALVMGALCVLSVATTGADSPFRHPETFGNSAVLTAFAIDVLFQLLLGGALFGAVVNLVVAAFRGQRAQPPS